MQNVFLLVAAITGAGIAFQVIINTQLRITAGSVLWAAIIQFTVGLAALGTAALLVRERVPAAALLRAPWWMWTGGLFGATYIVLSVVVSRRLGTAVLLASTVVGQLTMALVIDHWGLLGAPVHRLSASRILGALLLVAGVFVMRWR